MVMIIGPKAVMEIKEMLKREGLRQKEHDF